MRELARRSKAFLIGAILAASFSASPIARADLANLRNCYNASETRSSEIKCAVESGMNNLYPQLDKQGVAIAGCYDLSFHRVSDIPGDGMTGECLERNAPIRYYLHYRTLCSNGESSCTYGAQIRVSAFMKVDGPTIFGEGYNLNLVLGLPVKIQKGAKDYSGSESCEVLAKADSRYEWNYETQSCTKTPAAVCKEIGFHWSPEDSKCISGHSDTVANQPTQCDAAQCMAVMGGFCSGYPYQPAASNCYCPGTSEDFDRHTGMPAYTDKGPCQWLHYDIVMNPVCDNWSEGVEYVADTNDPSKDRCCKNGDCTGGYSYADKYGAAVADPLLQTTPKNKSTNAGILPRNFIQMGPPDPMYYPSVSPGRGLSSATLRPN